MNLSFSVDVGFARHHRVSGQSENMHGTTQPISYLIRGTSG